MRSAATSMPASRPPGTAGPGSCRSGPAIQLHRKPGRPGPHDFRPLHQSAVRPKRRADQLSRRRRHGEQRRRHRCDHNRPWTTVGGIVGTNYGAISNVYSSGSVTAISAGAGGLVGYNFQTLSNGYSNSAVSGPLYVGGAVGLNNIAAGPTAGLISQVYATGAVTGTGGSPSAIGGLVGLQRQLHHAILLG